ncbi:hypothetical protein KBD20_01390 [Candidatus Saccharibacteria bacterium]|nr:hypothetical protein [Candidatus Saccharibacteria bacterium]
MVDKESNHTHNEGESPVFSEAESRDLQRAFNHAQLQRAYVILSLSLHHDQEMARFSDITKSFVSHSVETDTYPFAHYRVKLLPKNRVQSQIKVAAVRFPAEGYPDALGLAENDGVYIAWETLDGVEHTFVLDEDEFSRIDLSRAFQPEQPSHVPNDESRTPTDATEQFLLEIILNDFEQDLQVHTDSIEV